MLATAVLVATGVSAGGLGARTAAPTTTAAEGVGSTTPTAGGSICAGRAGAQPEAMITNKAANRKLKAATRKAGSKAFTSPILANKHAHKK